MKRVAATLALTWVISYLARSNSASFAMFTTIRRASYGSDFAPDDRGAPQTRIRV